jgi:hypothetical protein
MDDPDNKLILAVTELCNSLRSDVTKMCEKMDADNKARYDAVADALKKKKDGDDDGDPANSAATRLAADAVSRSELEVVRAQLRDLQVKQPRQRSDADRNAFAEIQSKADVAHRALGGQADAPMVGEELLDYTLRLHRGLQKHSKQFAKAELHVLARDPSTLATVCDSIRADAVAASMSTEGMQPFQHRAVETIGPGGHRITTFHGVGSFYKQLSRPARHVLSIGAKNQGASRGGAFYSNSAV